MRRIVCICFMLSIGLSLHAQEDCSDVIHPTEGKSVIFNCCIDEVKYGNVVFYTKDGASSAIQAVAITKGGQYITLEKYSQQKDTEEKVVPVADSLYKGHDYNYYLGLYHKATSRKRAGIFLTVIGFGMEVAGIVLLGDNTTANDNTGTGLYVAGSIAFNVGIPIWIANGIKRKNNKRAMGETKKDLNLTLGPNQTGMGLAFHF